MERLLQDARLAVRLLWKDRGFTATAVATLALCLAANAVIFALVHAVLLRPLPVPEPDRLVLMWNSYPGAGVTGRGLNGVPDYFDRRGETDVFAALAMYRGADMTLGGQGAGDVVRAPGQIVTPSFFPLIGATAARGRLFTDEDGEVGQHRKVVLSHALWQQRFAGRDDALGQDLRVNGVPYEVIGILPEGFRFLDPDVQLWRPAAFSPEDRGDDRRHSNNWQMVGRLRAGVSVEQAQAQIDALNARNLERFPHMREVLTNAGFHTPVRGFHAQLTADARPILLLLWAGVAVVLVIGCVNVANLVSVRATARTRELVTRLALGASYGQVARQILTESVVLALAGGAAGLTLAWWALGWASAVGVDRLPRGGDVALDPQTFGYALLLVALVAALVGLLPMVALRRADLAQITREEGRGGTASRRTRVVRRALVTSQVALALMLLSGAGLLLASFERVLAVDPGFRPARVISGSISLPAARYEDDGLLVSTVDRILERVRALPGVEHAGITTSIPLGGDYSDSVILAEGYQMAPGESLISPSEIRVSPGYLEAMGIPLRRGRVFDARDAAEAPRTIVVDESLAKKFWPGQDPIGRRMYQPQSAEDVLAPPTDPGRWLEVVGVVGDVKLQALDGSGGSGIFGTYYRPYAQAPQLGVSLAVRASQDPEALTSAVRAATASVDAELPLYNIRSMEQRLEQSLIGRRGPMLLAVTFALVALFLAAIGIYGVLAYQVSQRRREIGVRMALGAGRGSIFGLVLSEGAVIVGLGLVLGLGGAYLVRQTLQSQLFGIEALDPGVLGGVSLLLGAVALVACLLPARAAARTNPVTALAE